MPQPLIFVSTHAIADGATARIAALGETFANDVAGHDTGLLAFHSFLSEDGTRVSNVQVHRDAGSMDAYLPIAQRHIEAALALSTPQTIEVFGEPGPLLTEVLGHNADRGAAVRVLPRHIGGFARA